MSTEYCIYLRKSRADLEAEARGAGDTLARHERILLDLAKSRSLPIGAIYRELASGERISTRPVIQQLLAEVEAGRWLGVLVSETSRLARGDTIDQGVVAQAFKYSHTLIVTPQKDFDPSDEMDEEWFEMGLFMSRQEYRMIRRRQLAGMQAAKREGRYLGNKPPYGYERIKLSRGWSLRPIPEQAKVVQMIFDLYLSGLGYSRIADRLNALHIPAPKNAQWRAYSIPGILSNPHYAGFIPQSRRPGVKQVKDGNLIVMRPRTNKPELYEGLHEPIISRDIWQAAQNRNNKTARIPRKLKQSNPLAGLIVCDCCGKLMQRRPASPRSPYAVIMCKTKGCPTVGRRVEEIETYLIDALRQFLVNLELHGQPETPDLSAEQEALSNINKQLSDLDNRIRKTFELVEDGTYTREIFLARQSELSRERNSLECAKNDLLARIDSISAEARSQRDLIPHIHHVLDTYDFTDSAEARNILLKQVLDHVDYHKRINNRWTTESDFSLTLHPKVFSHTIYR